MTDIPGGSTPHVDPDVLADLQEGLLDGPAADAATAHLAGCAACRGDLAALDEVRDRLAGAPDVGPLPADLVDRLDLALAGAAAEPALSVASPTVVPLRAPETKSPRGMRVLQIAAVLVLVLAGGAIGGVGAEQRAAAAATTAPRLPSEAGGDSAAEAGRRGHLPGDRHRPGLDATRPCRRRRPGSPAGALAPAAVGQLGRAAGARRGLEELRQRRRAQPRSSPTRRPPGSRAARPWPTARPSSPVSR